MRVFIFFIVAFIASLAFQLWVAGWEQTMPKCLKSRIQRRKRKFFLFFITLFYFLIPCGAWAGDFKVSGSGEKWNKWDVGLEISWEAIQIMDWGTTRNLSHRYHEGRYEMDPIYGKYPSTTKVDAIMLTGAVVHPVITHLLPRTITLWDIEIPARRIFQSVTIMSSGTCVVNNFALGLRMEF